MRVNAHLPALLILALLASSVVLLAPAPAQAASISLGFAGQGIYPQLATANSQRWFRVTVTWNGAAIADDNQMPNEYITGLYLDRGVTYNSGFGGDVGGPSSMIMMSTDAPGGAAQLGPSPRQRGIAVHPTPAAGVHSHTVTVGPFAGYNADYLVGWVGSRLLDRTDNSLDPIEFRFRLRWMAWNSSTEAYEFNETELVPTYQTLSVPVPAPMGGTPAGSLDSSGEQQAWYSGLGLGVDPLTVTPTATGTPDDGPGSSRYIFRTRYFSWFANLPPVWRHTDDRTMPNEGANWCDFDLYVANYLATGGDDRLLIGTFTDDDYPGHYEDWLYSIDSDPRMDRVGEWVGRRNPEALLVMNRDYTNPAQMVREAGSLSGGLTFRYDLLPSNALQLVNNILLFPFDPVGQDPWDIVANGVFGRPTGNNYVAMRPGGHTYEFLTTRDWDPPVWGIPHNAAPGAFTRVGKTAVALAGRPGNNSPALESGALTALHVVRDGVGFTGVHAEELYGWFNDVVGSGYGYAYDSQDLDRYPQVDPVLTAHPYFEEGYPWPGYRTDDWGPGAPGALPNPFNPLADNGEPWGPVVGPTTTLPVGSGGYGPGRVSALRFTNADTISPNLVNIWDDTVAFNPNLSQPSAHRGGKWTTDTTFVFRINYWQSENLAPRFSQVFIRKVQLNGTPITGWQGYSMQKADPGDSDYTNGVVYYFEASAAALPGGGGPGDYQYYFSFSDGTQTCIYPNRPAESEFGSIGVPPGDNDWFWFRVNQAPTLSDRQLAPTVGTQGQSFIFNVTYRDLDGMAGAANPQGDPPFKALLWIDLFGDVEGQMKVVSVVGSTVTYEFDPAGGEPYPAGSLVAGTHFERKTLQPESGAGVSQPFEIVGNDVVDATQGTIELAAPPTGLAPGDMIHVADWFPCIMEQVNPADTNYADGAQFYFDTARAGLQLDPGMHHHFFEFWDNWAYWFNWDQYFLTPNSTPPDLKLEGERVRLPAAEGAAFEGPMVLENREPEVSRLYYIPPSADTVTGLPAPDTISYLRPLNRDLYADGSLVGKFLRIETGTARRVIFPITANSGPNITVGPSIPGDRNPQQLSVVLGNTFRIFEDYDAEGGLSWAHRPVNEFDGTAATGFTLYCVYRDPDNNPPASVRMAAYPNDTPGTPPSGVHEMVRVDDTDNAFTVGVLYRSRNPVSLPPGRHYLRAQANDGALWAGGGADATQFFGPTGLFGGVPAYRDLPAPGPHVKVNTPPNPPLSGFMPTGGAIVNTATPELRWNPATDPDPGDQVVGYTVQLSRTGFAGGSYDYQYTTNTNSVTVPDALSDLTSWSWRVRSEDLLGAQSVWSEVQDFYVDLLRPPPVLAPPANDPAQALSPLTGDLSTAFTYRVVYSQADNDPPSGGIYLEINDVLYPTPLDPVNPADTNYVDGAEFRIVLPGNDAALGYGAHDFRFRVAASAWPAPDQDPRPGPWINSPSALVYTDSTYAVQEAGPVEIGDTLYLRVRDDNRSLPAGPPLQTVEVTVTVVDGADSEILTLTETGVDTGVFVGALPTAGSATAVPGDGTLQLYVGAAGKTVRTAYVDTTLDPDAPITDEATASILVVNTVPPPKVQPFVQITTAMQGDAIHLDWSTYPAPWDLAGFHVWIDTAPFNSVVGRTPHAALDEEATGYSITGLTPGTYYVAVTAFDIVPNEDRIVDAAQVDLQEIIPANIRGHVRLNGQGLAGVQVAAGAFSTTTGADGSYTLPVPDGDYTVTPTREHYTFTPASRDVTVSGVDVVGVDFAATGIPYEVHGVINDWTGAPVAGVQVVANGVTGTTNALGHYTLADLTAGQVVVTPQSDDWTFSPTQRTVNVPTVESINFTAYPKTAFTVPAGINLLGLPFDPPDRNPVTVFGTTQVRRWHPTRIPPAYVGPGDPGSGAVLEVRPGRGYFVNFATGRVLEGAGTPVPVNAPYSMTLGPQWNMLANPFLVRLPLANVRPAVTGGVAPYAFVYDNASGSYLFISSQAGANVARSYLEPWEGAWFRSLIGTTSVAATYPVNPAEVDQAAPPALELGPSGWVIPVVARAGSRADLCGALGVSEQGAWQVPNPPAAPQGVDLYFLDDDGVALAQQVKPAGVAAQAWSFVVATDLPDTEVAVSLPDLSQVPSDLVVTLVDEATGQRVFMRTAPRYVFQSGEQGAVRRFRLEIGPRGADNLVISAASAQHSGAVATISYTISQACEVNVEILNISGRVVRRLTAGAAEAGVNALSWKLRNDQGAAVPAGMYLVRVQAVSSEGQKVQALAPLSLAR